MAKLNFHSSETVLAIIGVGFKCHKKNHKSGPYELYVVF